MQDKTKIFKKPLFIYLIVIFLIIIISIFFIIKKQQESSMIKVSLSYMPNTAKILINNQSVSNNSQTLLSPGTYSITVSAEGYETYSSIIEVTEKNNSFFGILSSNNDSEENSTLYDAFLQEKINENNKRIESYYPIIQYLPLNSANQPYGIRYTISENLEDFTVIATIKKDPEDIIFIDYYTIKNILNYINKQNEPYDLTPYNIEIKGFTNKLTDFIDNNESDPISFLTKGYQNYYNIDNLEVMEGVKEGNYYYTTIEEHNPDNYGDSFNYSVVLKEKDNTWELVAKPNLILTIHNTSGVPNDILHKANNYSPNKYYNKADR